MDAGKIFESDVPLETKILVDLYSDSDDASHSSRLLTFDIEVEVIDGFPDPERVASKVTAISFYDHIMDEYYVYILDEENSIEQVRNGNEEIVPFNNEKEMLLAFLDKWEEIAPTIITGWNIEGFDIPYLYRRMKKLFGTREASRLSPIGIVRFSEMRGRYVIAGISTLDALPLYKHFTFTQLPSYTLDNVAKKELGRGKIEYDGDLETLRKTNINKYIEYSLEDTKLVVDMEKKLLFIELAQGVCHKGHVPYEDLYFSSRWIEGAMLTYMKRKGLIAPNKSIRNKQLMENTEVRFSGAYVKSPESIRYEWIYDLDFTSLYPSIIMTLNISPETKVGKVENWNSEKHLHDKNIVYDIKFDKDEGSLSGEQIQSYIEKNDYGISSNGVLYRQDKQGLIPQILEEWMKDKDNYDTLMKQYGNKGDKVQSKYYKQRRTIAKVMLNSVYGALGLPVFRFYNKDNAEAVTTTGVSLIKYSEKMANARYNEIIGTDNKDYVAYIDTDSLFLLAKPLIEKLYPEVDTTDSKLMSEKILEITSEIQGFLNKSFSIFAKRLLNLSKHKFDIKQEVIARSGIWVAKKRYALWITNEAGVEVDDIEIKGLDIVRSTFPILFKVFFKEIVNDLLKYEKQDTVDAKIVEFKSKIKTAAIVEIANSSSVNGLKKYGTFDDLDSKIFNNWIKGTPVHVKAALSYNALIEYHKLKKHYAGIKQGEKIKWVYLKPNEFGINGLAFKGYDDPKEIVDFLEKYIDKQKMVENVLDSKLTGFYDAVNWDLPSPRQRLADKFFG